MKKKKEIFFFLVHNRFGLLPNCIVKKKKLYCNLAIVLQETREKAVGLYCKMGVVAVETVLQYSLLYCKRR